MAFLLEHLPPQVHLVIASRADPALPLARLRARGELVEIRAADLRFTAEEAAAFLNEAMGLDLDRGGRRRAGGAHRGLDRRAPARRALDAGPGRRRRLHRRVRRRRPLHRRLPGRGGAGRASPTRSASSCCRPRSWTGSAARSATRSPGATAARRCWSALERANLFVVPLDDRRELVPLPPPVRRRAARPAARRAAQDRRAASARQRVVRRRREPAEAIRHALAAGTSTERRPGRARLPAMRANAGNRPASLALELPASRAEPAGAEIRARRRANVDRRVRRRGTAAGRSAGAGRARRRADGRPRCRVPDPAGRDRAVPRWAVADARRYPGHEKHARAVLELAGPDQHQERGGAAGLLALAAWTGGDLGAAYDWWSQAIRDLERAG